MSAVHWNWGKVFQCSLYGHWLLVGDVGIRGKIKTGIIHPMRQATVEGDAYEGVTLISNICVNCYENKKVMVHIRKVLWAENASSNIIVDDVFI